MLIIYFQSLGDIKKMYHAIHILQLDNIPLLIKLGYDPCNIISNMPQGYRHEMSHYYCQTEPPTSDVYPLGMDFDEKSESSGRATRLEPELWKTLISLCRHHLNTHTLHYYYSHSFYKISISLKKTREAVLNYYFMIFKVCGLNTYSLEVLLFC